MFIVEALRSLGAWPSNMEPGNRPTGLISALITAWQSRADSTTGPARRKADRILKWLQRQREQGAHAELLTSGENSSPLQDAIGTRLVWWPRGKPLNRQVGIVSSRIGRKFDEQAEWFQSLRLAVGSLDKEHSLITSKGMTTYPFMARLAELLCIEITELQISPVTQSPDRFFEWLMEVSDEEQSSKRRQGVVSPSLNENPLTDLPQTDLIVSYLADQIWALSIRNESNTETLLRRGLRSEEFKAGSVRLLCGPGLVGRAIAESLQNEGAVCWYLTERAENSQPQVASIKKERRSSNHGRTSLECFGSAFDITSSGLWLTHCTRSPNIAQPGEERTSFLRRLVLSESERQSPLESLKRMLGQGKISASDKGISGGHSVVCFSSTPLRELLRQRKWQTHRVRWDFEPYGICFRAEALTRFEVQQVLYGDDSDWQRLSSEKQPWFQKRFSNVGADRIDWSKENEWRIIGDIDLSRLSKSDAFVFVPTESEAVEVAPLSPFPIKLTTETTPPAESAGSDPT